MSVPKEKVRSRSHLRSLPPEIVQELASLMEVRDRHTLAADIHRIEQLVFELGGHDDNAIIQADFTALYFLREVSDILDKEVKEEQYVHN